MLEKHHSLHLMLLRCTRLAYRDWPSKSGNRIAGLLVDVL